MTGRAKSMLAAISEWIRRSPHVFRNRVPFGGASIGARLTACFVVILLSMMAADLVTVWQFRRITAEARRLVRADETSLSVVRIHFDVETFRDKLAAVTTTHDIRQFRMEAASLRQKFVEDVAQSQQLLRASDVPGRDPAIASGLETLRTTLPSQLDTTIELASAGDWPAVDLRLRNQVQALIELTALLVEKVDRDVSQERAQAVESGNQAHQQLVLVLPVAALLTLLVAVALGWYATRSITDPLSELEAGAQALAQGDFQHQVTIRGHDELAQLGQVFNHTARQLAALYETLRRNEALFRLTIDTIPAYVWSALPDGSVDFINQRWLEFSGMNSNQTFGWGWEAAVHPEDRDGFLEAWRAAVASGKGMEAEARVRSADGQYRWLLIRNVPLRDETGKIVKWYGTSTDIEDRKRTEQTLRQSEAYLAEGQRLAHTGSWAFDLPSNRYIYASEECLRIFEIDAIQDWPTREAISRLIHPEDWDRVNRSFEKSVRGEMTESEFRVLLPSGTVKHIQVTRHPVLNDAGDVARLVGTVIDVTERKRAEEERERLRQLEADLRHVNRVSVMGELAASVAHEVNQPLSGVVSNGSACLRWLAGDVPNVEEARETARRIVRDGKRAGEIIARIRAMATKSAATRQEELDLNGTIREVLALAGDEAKKRSVVIQTQFADDLSPVSGDRVQLQQVVLNLVMNAIEAMSSVDGRARELVITTRNIDAGQVQATVRDSGTGLDPNAIDKAFDPFYTTKSGGMGMGLSISRSIVQAHGGRLWATAHDGPGTMFHFALPKHHDRPTTKV